MATTPAATAKPTPARRPGAAAWPAPRPFSVHLTTLAAFTLVGHPLFYLVWGRWLAQPFESLWARLAMALLGAALLALQYAPRVGERLRGAATDTILWITLPCFFWWMYFHNGANAVWMASVGAMLLIYCQIVRWPLATFGAAAGALAAWVLFRATGAAPPWAGATDLLTQAAVIGFCWAAGAALGASLAMLKRKQLQQALATLGVIAHELRTPMATVQQISEALAREAEQPHPSAARVAALSSGLQGVVRHVNYRIDSQVANARLLHLESHAELLAAAGLVREAVATYPYRSQPERDAVVVEVRADFSFQGSRLLLLQAVHNLLSNALRALDATARTPDAGDVRIALDIEGSRGRIVVSDRGVGIAPELQSRIFEPFVSSGRSPGQGLGLAFCQRVVQQSRGRIRVRSRPGHGATFVIELPLAVRA